MSLPRRYNWYKYIIFLCKTNIHALFLASDSRRTAQKRPRSAIITQSFTQKTHRPFAIPSSVSTYYPAEYTHHPRCTKSYQQVSSAPAINGLYVKRNCRKNKQNSACATFQAKKNRSRHEKIDAFFHATVHLQRSLPPHAKTVQSLACIPRNMPCTIIIVRARIGPGSCYPVTKNKNRRLFCISFKHVLHLPPNI